MKRSLALIERYFFEREPGYSEILLRTLIGASTVWWALSWTVDAAPLLSNESLFPTAGRGALSWSLLSAEPAPRSVYLMLAATALSGVMLSIGRWPRVAICVAFLGVVSIQRAQPMAINAGDQLLRLLLAWMALGALVGTTATLSGTFRRFDGERPRTIVRLFQLQIVVIYASSALWKLQGSPWRDGTAVFFVLRNPSVAWLPIPSFLADYPLGWSILTYATVLVEAALPVLLVVRRTRVVGVAIGCGLHLCFAYALRVGIFTPVMIVGLSAFLPQSTIAKLVHRFQPTTLRS